MTRRYTPRDDILITRHLCTVDGHRVDRPHLLATVASILSSAQYFRRAGRMALAREYARFARTTRLRNVAAFRPVLP